MKTEIFCLDFTAREHCNISMKRIENSNDDGTLVLSRRKELELTQKEAAASVVSGIVFAQNLKMVKRPSNWAKSYLFSLGWA